MMTSAHIAKLKSDVQKFLDRQSKTPVPLLDVKQHVIGLGWNLMDDSVFKGWLKDNFPSARINYGG